MAGSSRCLCPKSILIRSCPMDVGLHLVWLVRYQMCNFGECRNIVSSPRNPDDCWLMRLPPIWPKGQKRKVIDVVPTEEDRAAAQRRRRSSQAKTTRDGTGHLMFQLPRGPRPPLGTEI